MATEPTVLFGVGATKAGTSWVYRYLHDRDDCQLPSVKELHYFDTLDFAEQEYQLAQFGAARDVLTSRVSGADAGRRDTLNQQVEDYDALIAMLGEGGTVSDYRAFLLGRSNGGLVADITPSYSLLSQERLASMASEFSTSRFLFLMRDPVERLWSHVRMMAKRRLRDGEEFSEKARRFLMRICTKGELPQVAERGDYAGTIQRLQAAVPAGRLMIEFSENLYTVSGVKRLCEFLGLSYRAGNLDRYENMSMALAMTDAQRDMARNYLAPQYAYVKDSFGELPDVWQANMVGTK